MYCQLEPLKSLYILLRKHTFLGSCDHIQWFQWLQLTIPHWYVILNGCHMHWNEHNFAWNPLYDKVMHNFAWNPLYSIRVGGSSNFFFRNSGLEGELKLLFCRKKWFLVTLFDPKIMKYVYLTSDDEIHYVKPFDYGLNGNSLSNLSFIISFALGST